MLCFLTCLKFSFVWILFFITKTLVNGESSVNTPPSVAGRIIDITHIINEYTSGNLTQTQFVTLCNESFQTIFDNSPNHNLSSITAFYDSGCSIFDICDELLNQISYLVKQAVGDQRTFTFIVGLRYELKTVSKHTQNTVGLRRYINNTHHFLLQLPHKIFCSDLKDETNNEKGNILSPENWGGQLFNIGVGIGYDEELIGCDHLRKLLDNAYFSFVRTTFGNNAGVAESYGLFEKRMNHVFEMNQQFRQIFPQFNFHFSTTKENVLFVNPISLGDANHQYLFVEYGKRWIHDTSSSTGIVLPPLPFKNKPLEQDSFPTVAYYAYGFDTSWTIPFRLSKTAQRFTSIILPIVSWDEVLLQFSPGVKNLVDTAFIPAKQLELILDYSTVNESDAANRNWEKDETDLKMWNKDTTLYFKKYTKIKVLSFKLFKTNSSNYSIAVNQRFAEKMAENYTIGCNLTFPVIEGMSLFGTSESDAVIESCRAISGSLYVLHSTVKMNDTNRKDTLFYVNVVRNVLIAVKNFRDEILLKHPTATVYSQLKLDIEFPYELNNTVFCNPIVLNFNEYYEAILTWSRLNNFPVILKSVNDHIFHPEIKSWLSHLHPYENPDASVSLFANRVVRNYPENINNWSIDPCVEWTYGRPDIPCDFFQNKDIGAILHLESTAKTQIGLTQELGKQLELLLNQFHLVEIIVENNLEEVASTLKSSSIRHPVHRNKSIFVSVQLPPTRNETNYLISMLKRNELHQLSQVKAIQIDGSGFQNGESVTGHYLAGLYLLHSSGNLEMLTNTVRELNVSVGVVLHSRACVNLFLSIAITSMSDSVIGSLDYITCVHTIALSELGNPKQFGHAFDLHLYILRGLKEYYPSVEILFRIEVEAELNENWATMNRYLRLLSHFKKFAMAYNVSYFIVEGFDSKFGRKNGWYKVNNDTGLGPTYIEKEPEFSGRRCPMRLAYESNKPNSELTNANETDFKLVSIIASTLVVAIVLTVLLAGYFYVRHRALVKYLSDKEVQEFLHGRSQETQLVCENDSNFVNPAEFMQFKKELQISKADIYFDSQKILGSGNFGIVFQGTVRNNLVAIKTPHENCPKMEFKTFLSEVKLLSYIGEHEFVMGFVGAYVNEIERGVLYIASEFCSNGSLHGYLRKTTNVIEQGEEKTDNTLWLSDLNRFSLQIVSGMNYIHSKLIVHGDLATRNVLLDADFTCKIGDFGLSRKLYEYQKYVKTSQQPLPWKWMAPESLEKMEFTLKADVWSFAVTLWEIYSLGAVPYGGLNWTTGFVQEVKNGLRLDSPKFLSDELYKLMMDCWNIDAKQRPTFAELTVVFKEDTNKEYVCLDEE